MTTADSSLTDHPPACATQRQMDAGDKIGSRTSHPFTHTSSPCWVWPRAGLGGLRKGASKEPEGRKPGDDTLPPWTCSPWNIIPSLLKKFCPHLHPSYPWPLKPVAHLSPLLASKDQERDYASKGQMRKTGSSSLPTPIKGCCALRHFPSSEKIYSASRDEVFLGESTLESGIHSSESRMWY